MIIRSIGIGLFWLSSLAAGLWLADFLVPQPIILVVPIYDQIQSVMADQVEDVLTNAAVDSTVAGIVFVIDSGGGGIIASERIYHAILQTRRTKPVVVFVSGSAQSGGYFIASAAQSIVAPASSEIGNVGALHSRNDYNPPFSLLWYFSGPYKLGSTRFDTIQHLDLDKGTFAESVYHRRLQAPNPLTLSLAELSEARSYLGREALALGLIDAIGGRMDAVRTVAHLAGVADFQVVEAEIASFWSVFSTNGLQDDAAALPASSPTAEGE